jgi:hypothetical protein
MRVFIGSPFPKASAWSAGSIAVCAMGQARSRGLNGVGAAGRLLASPAIRRIFQSVHLLCGDRVARADLGFAQGTGVLFRLGFWRER